MTIGQKLKQKRTEMGLTLEDVSADLKISIKVLEAIEGDSTQDTPPPAILKGFIRAYCRHLKLDESTGVTSVVPSEVNRVTKSDLELIDQGVEAGALSWLKWAVAGGVLIGIALTAKLTQKYKAEKYPAAEVATFERNEDSNLDSVTEPEPAVTEEALEELASVVPQIETVTSNSEPNQSTQQEFGAHQEKNKMDASLVDKAQNLKEAVKPDAKLESVPDPKKEEKAQNIVDKTDTTTPPETSTDTPLSMASKEVIIEAKNQVTVLIAKKGKPPEEKQLESGVHYLFKQTPPFEIRSSDARALQVTVNGRIIHLPASQSRPLKLEIKE